MGFNDECFQQGADEMMTQRLLRPSGNIFPMAGSLGARESRGSGWKKRPHPAGTLVTGHFFPSPTAGLPQPAAKPELYSEKLAAQDLIRWFHLSRPKESRHSERAEKIPLELLSRKADNFLNSTFTNIASIQKMEQPELLEISSRDAHPRGNSRSDWVRVFNQRGEVRLRAHVNGSVHAGVVARG